MFKPITAILPLTTISSMITIIIQRHHLLMTLLALESITLTMILMLTIFVIKTNSLNSISILILLSFAACEASLGLATLISISRQQGNDMISSLTSNKC